MPDPGRSNRKLISEIRVEACLGHSQPDLSDQLALLWNERLQLHEEGVGYCTAPSEPDNRPAGRARVGVDDVNGTYAGVQYLAEPLRGEVRDLVRDGGNVRC